MTFVPDPRITGYLRRKGKGALREEARETAKVAKVLAPKRTGAYSKSFVVVDEGPGGDVRLGNTDYKAHWIEWGTVKWPPHATLRRAVLTRGLELRKDPR